VIDARGLRARVGEFELRDVSFVVPAGKYGVVIGPAGSGKTTLLETIAGIIPLRGGALVLSGQDMSGVSP
jgi:ABC-type branched-subunit amino acid transport system ATPase component